MAGPLATSSAAVFGQMCWQSGGCACARPSHVCLRRIVGAFRRPWSPADRLGLADCAPPLRFMELPQPAHAPLRATCARAIIPDPWVFGEVERRPETSALVLTMASAQWALGQHWRGAVGCVITSQDPDKDKSQVHNFDTPVRNQSLGSNLSKVFVQDMQVQSKGRCKCSSFLTSKWIGANPENGSEHGPMIRVSKSPVLRFEFTCDCGGIPT